MQDPDWLESKNLDNFEQKLFMVYDPETTDAERIQKILDLKYSQADLQQVVQELKQLTLEQQSQLLKTLRKYEALFDGTLGTWKTEQVELELKGPNCAPFHAHPYPVPQSHEKN